MSLDALRSALVMLEAEWGHRPVVVLACAGGSDEHWQIYRHDDYVMLVDAMPEYTIMNDVLEKHP